MQAVLVIGGAGYVGSHMCKYLAQQGYNPIVLDNLIYGHREAVKWGTFVYGDVGDRALLERIFSQNTITCVMHFAAFLDVKESIAMPLKYYQNNVAATLNLIEMMIQHQVSNFIFSSSCTTYGNQIKVPITEDHPQDPISPYGRSKLVVEQILQDIQRAHDLNYICLRYFNAAEAALE